MDLFVKLVFIFISILYILFPKAMWKITYGWQMKEGSEPTEEALILFRMSGALFLVIMGFALFH
ncbi:Hypothetical protein LUCI_3420 [Lucifera butyrica]|uniref:DUF6199 domain-containing protein n=1 Tax=Lucifera butyrica TaxID=1351585 RepID=A0A498RAY2_9FIRM|nr:DUF6199 family natural product biosynthesis protein [Lucifera butyrica]VBB08155.1 Hypothetical protein LUCI_3420 [Lucifera butyrica]